MFKFNIFNGAQWQHLAHAHLHGFPGFVFGILILAALPLYFATTVIVIRNQEIPVQIPKIPLPQIKKTPVSDTAAPEDKQDSTEKDIEISPDVPFEIQSTYMRALKKLDLLQITTPQPDESAPQIAPDSTQETIPLPSDFDISFEDIEQAPDATPVFTEINFDTPSNTNTTPSVNDDIINYLNKSGQEFTVQDNVIITPQYAIASHCDTDFWVTDTDTWFATGKSCPSPVSAVKAVANANNLTPVLYLGSENILDLENLIPQWESDGIKIITNLDQL